MKTHNNSFVISVLMFRMLQTCLISEEKRDQRILHLDNSTNWPPFENST